MSPRDFTDEHVRSAIPKMRPEEDPSSPLCADLNLISRGAVAQMKLPKDWIFGERENSGARRYSFQNFHPADNEAVSMCFFYRGNRIEQTTAKSFLEIVERPIHQLTKGEIKSIEEILQDRADPEYFDLALIKAKTLNGKKILVIEGYFKQIPEGRLELFVRTEQTGTVIQEIFYQAPISEYTKYRQAACNAFDSIVWKDQFTV